MYGPITGITADRLHGPGDADGHLRTAREDAAWLFNARMKPRKILGNPRETSWNMWENMEKHRETS